MIEWYRGDQKSYLLPSCPQRHWHDAAVVFLPTDLDVAPQIDQRQSHNFPVELVRL